MEIRYIRILIVQYDTAIQEFEVPLFRGAVIGAISETANLLFHNHISDEKLRYSYPLIQYKRIHGKPAIVCVEEGVDVIGQYLAEGNTFFMLGNRQVEMNVDKIMPRRIIMQTWQNMFLYSIRRWHPLNSENYKIYQQLDSITGKLDLLVKILKGNILSFAKGINLKIEEEILVEITDFEEPHMVKYKGTSVMAFNLKFKTNISLPDFIGLGKNASVGFGIVKREFVKKNQQNIE